MNKTKLVVLAIFSWLLPCVIAISWYNTISWGEQIHAADLVTGVFAILVFLSTGIWSLAALCKGKYHAT